MIPSARSLILNLMLASDERSQSARATIASCALFGIRENNVRVALARLVAEGLIEPTRRGVYRLGPRATALADDVATWRTAEERVRGWAGDWITVHVGPLGRSDRVALRARNRALAMLGLRELDRGLYVRPDNLEGGVIEARERLHRLGLEPAAAVFVATGFDAEREARARKLWDGERLSLAYRTTRHELEQWHMRAGTLGPETAAREAYLLGNAAIRQIVFDPLLPAPLVDVDERRAFVAAVRRHDDTGRECWRRLHLGTGKDGAAAPHSFPLQPHTAPPRP